MGEKGRDSLSDDGAVQSGQSGTGETCAICGTAIDESEWYPIRGREDEDGGFRLYSFCSEDCVDSWSHAGE